MNYLGRHRHRRQAQPLANAILNFRAEMRRVAHRARNLSHRHLRRGVSKSRDIALILRKPVGYFQSEGDRLRVNSVRAADLWRVSKFVSAQIEHFAEKNQPALD